MATYTIDHTAIDRAVAALNRLSNDPDISAKVLNPPVRKALATFAKSIRQHAPRQTLAKARKMRSYARFANFPRLFQRIGSSFKGSTKKKEAEGKAGVNVRVKKAQWAPQGTWTAAGTNDRWIKPHHITNKKRGAALRVLKQGIKGGPGYRGKITKMGFVPAGVSAVAASAIATAETEIKTRFADESLKLDGTPFRR